MEKNGEKRKSKRRKRIQKDKVESIKKKLHEDKISKSQFYIMLV